jgi:hypothetical protein
MPEIGKMKEKNEKKLIISQFFDLDDTEVFIYIKKMDLKLKRKVYMMTMASMNNPAGKELIKKLTQGGKSLDDFDKMDNIEIAAIMIDVKFDLTEQEKISDFGAEVEKMVIEECINPANHNFTKDGITIPVNNYEFWNEYGNDELIKFIVKEIRLFSESFVLKKKTMAELTIPSDV